MCTTARSCQISLASNPSSCSVCAHQAITLIDDLSDELSDRLNDRVTPIDALADHDVNEPACVMVFNANDASGAAGLSADTTAIASVGAHALPVVTGAYSRDTHEIHGYFALGDEAVTL